MSNIEELIRIAREEGIDVADLILNELSKVDPQRTPSLRLQLAEGYMNECKEYMHKGDAIQASEKAYKVAEELIKALAEKYGIPEYQEAIKEGRWFTHLLQRAANTLAQRLGDWVLNGWSVAYALHVWGFHEGRLGVNDITRGVAIIETMLNETRKVLSQ